VIVNGKLEHLDAIISFAYIQLQREKDGDVNSRRLLHLDDIVKQQYREIQLPGGKTLVCWLAHGGGQ
jgi:hypothetical protein